jgi:hypothetical protein
MRNEPDTPNLEPTQSKPSPDHRCTNLSGALNGVAIDEPHPCRDSRRYLIILIIGSHVAGPIASELGMVFPTAGGFHDSTDPRHERYRNDEFDGIDVFPFASTELSLLAVAPRLVELAERLMGERNLRIYSAEAWAKYTGATNYDQDLHRDYLNHTVLVPTTAQRHQQLEMFVFLSEVPEELGPPHLVSQRHTADLPANPNFYPRHGGHGAFMAADDHADLYDLEQSEAGPAGTVIAFNLGTLHRGTAVTKSCAPRRRHRVFPVTPTRVGDRRHLSRNGPTRSRSRASRKARNVTSTEKAVLHGEVKPVLHASAIALQAEFRPDGDHRPDRSTDS